MLTCAGGQRRAAEHAPRRSWPASRRSPRTGRGGELVQPLGPQHLGRERGELASARTGSSRRRIGPPGPWSGGGGGGAAVVKDQLTGAIVLPAASWAPLTDAVYVVFAASAARRRERGGLDGRVVAGRRRRPAPPGPVSVNAMLAGGDRLAEGRGDRGRGGHAGRAGRRRPGGHRRRRGVRGGGVEDDVDPVVAGLEGVGREHAAAAVPVDAVAAVVPLASAVQRAAGRRPRRSRCWSTA